MLFSVPLTDEPFNAEAVQCIVGDQPVKTVVGPHSINIMSRDKFRALRTLNFMFFTSTMVPTIVEKINFSGQFATKIEFNDKRVSFATIFIREGDEDYLIINRSTADILNI